MLPLSPGSINQKITKAQFAKQILDKGLCIGRTLVWDGEPHNSSFKVYYEDSTLYSTGTMEHYNLQGLRTCYYKNGNKWAEIEYKNGVIHGSLKKYHNNGQLQMEAVYENGVITGECVMYTKGGKVKDTITYSHGDKVRT